MSEKTIVTDFYDVNKVVKNYQKRNTFKEYALPDKIIQCLEKKRIFSPTLFQSTVMESAFESNEYDLVIQNAKREWTAFALGIAVSTIVHDLKNEDSNDLPNMTPYAVVLFPDSEACKIKASNFISLSGGLKCVTIISSNVTHFKCDIVLCTYDMMEQLINKKNLKTDNLKIIVIDCHDNFVDFDADKIINILNIIDPKKEIMRIFYAMRIFLNHRDKILKCIRKNARLIRTESVQRPFIAPISSERRAFLQRRLSVGPENRNQETRKKGLGRSQSIKAIKNNKPTQYTRGTASNDEVYTDEDSSCSR